MDKIILIAQAVEKLQRQGIEPKLITIHPVALKAIVEESPFPSKYNETAEYKIMGIKVARSIDVDPAAIYVS